MQVQFGTTGAGKPSAKMKSGRGWRTFIKIHHIALFEAQGFSDTEIGFALRCTPQYVRMLKNTPEYIGAKVAAATNILSQAEKDALQTLENRRQALEDLVPEALGVIRDTINNRNNPVLRLKAAQDLLDREGSLAKVSRTEVSLPKEHDLARHQKATDNLLSALNAINVPIQKEAEQLKEQPAGVEDFSKTADALDEEHQVKMEEAMDLINSSIDRELKEQNKKYVN